MSEQFTNAEDMARRAGLPNGKAFRATLRKRLPQHHERGSWRTVIGSAKHQAMERELAALIAGRSHA
jgi:hypothetical protein